MSVTFQRVLMKAVTGQEAELENRLHHDTVREKITSDACFGAASILFSPVSVWRYSRHLHLAADRRLNLLQVKRIKSVVKCVWQRCQRSGAGILRHLFRRAGTGNDCGNGFVI